MQITHRNSGLWLTARKWELCKPLISCKAMTKILYANSEKRFLKCEKMASRNLYRHFFHANFFMFVLLISIHSVFFVQFEVNWHLWVFQNAEIARAASISRANKLQTELETLWSPIHSFKLYLMILMCYYLPASREISVAGSFSFVETETKFLLFSLSYDINFF